MDKEAMQTSISQNLRCVTQSLKGGVPLNCLQKDYKELLGTSIPFLELGYKSLELFLQSIPDVVCLKKNENGQCMVEGVADACTSHIASLISKQKPAKSNKKKPKRFSHNKGGYAPRYASCGERKYSSSYAGAKSSGGSYRQDVKVSKSNSAVPKATKTQAKILDNRALLGPRLSSSVYPSIVSTVPRELAPSLNLLTDPLRKNQIKEKNGEEKKETTIPEKKMLPDLSLTKTQRKNLKKKKKKAEEQLKNASETLKENCFSLSNQVQDSCSFFEETSNQNPLETIKPPVPPSFLQKGALFFENTVLPPLNAISMQDFYPIEMSSTSQTPVKLLKLQCPISIKNKHPALIFRAW